MHLEDVTIEGFKSFSQPTEMSFQPGIGVIIGNNGVGKSNILDAIVWAMGEDDVGKLRCHGEEELFFFGSKAYPPAPKIRVELNFNSADGSGASSVRLIREKRRDGSEANWVQDQMCEREQYREQLAALQLPDALNTIIRQEQINDLLWLDPQRRFRWIQAFTGISDAVELSRLLCEEIGPQFRRYLEYLNPAGEGELQTLPPGDGPDGLEIEVTLPGNRRRKAHQLSGGEKSVASLALKLAIFDQLDSPFYLLDEVEPSLDYANHKSMQSLLKALAQDKQLIMITHLRSTIELANTVHGARTRWDGSSFMKFYFVMDERLLRLYKCC